LFSTIRSTLHISSFQFYHHSHLQGLAALEKNYNVNDQLMTVENNIRHKTLDNSHFTWKIKLAKSLKPEQWKVLEYALGVLQTSLQTF